MDADGETNAEAAAGCTEDDTGVGGTWHRLQGRLSRPSPRFDEGGEGQEGKQAKPRGADAATGQAAPAPVCAAAAAAAPLAASVLIPEHIANASADADQAPAAAARQVAALPPVPSGPAAALRQDAGASDRQVAATAGPAPVHARGSSGTVWSPPGPAVAADAVCAPDAAARQPRAALAPADLTVMPPSLAPCEPPHGERRPAAAVICELLP